MSGGPAPAPAVLPGLAHQAAEAALLRCFRASSRHAATSAKSPETTAVVVPARVVCLRTTRIVLHGAATKRRDTWRWQCRSGSGEGGKRRRQLHSTEPSCGPQWDRTYLQKSNKRDLRLPHTSSALCSSRVEPRRHGNSTCIPS